MPETETFTPAARPGGLGGLGICLVGINYAPDSTGIAPYTSAMARAFADAGAGVHVITGIPHYPQWRVTDPGYRRGSRWEEVLDGVRVTRLRHHVPPRAGLLGRGRMEASFLSRAAPAVRADDADVVIAVTPSLAGLAAGALGRRDRPFGVLVQDLTGNAAGESGSTGQRAARAIARAEYHWLRTADLVGVITPGFGTVLVEHGIGQHALVDLPNFTHITPSELTAAQARAQLGWPADAYTVVHTGNMGMKQGLYNVIEAARHSHSTGAGIRFVLVGDGNQRAELEAAGAGIPTLSFVDPLDSVSYPRALAAADALLLHERPGVREMSLPSKLTSYTSAGRPIIAAVDPDGITHTVISADDAALLVPPGDPVALVDAASGLRADAGLAGAYARKARGMHEARYSPRGARARYVAFADALRSTS